MFVNKRGVFTLILKLILVSFLKYFTGPSEVTDKWKVKAQKWGLKTRFWPKFVYYWLILLYFQQKEGGGELNPCSLLPKALFYNKEVSFYAIILLVLAYFLTPACVPGRSSVGHPLKNAPLHQKSFILAQKLDLALF